MSLPIALWQVYGWATPVISALIAFFLLGIENIGGSPVPCLDCCFWLSWACTIWSNFQAVMLGA